MKNVQNDQFIWSEQWRRKSGQILRRDNFMDQWILKTTGRMEPAEVVHHILPREDFPQYAMEDWNLIALSRRTHNKVIHTIKGKLTNEGKKLMYETAFINDIKLNEKILVIGKPGSGKTTWTRDQLGLDAMAYDLDAIAAAFRLTDPHAEIHKGSRKLAARLMQAFSQRAQDFAPRIFIIRSAPTPEEISQIKPDRLVICTRQYDIKNRKDFETFNDSEMEKKIEDAKKFAELNRIPVEMIPPLVEK